MNCIKCGAFVAITQHGGYDYASSYCENCNEISVERLRQRERWRAFHDEPCPEVELTQFPSTWRD